MPQRKIRHLTRLSDLTPQPVSWLWPGFLAGGKLTLIDGDPDQGKSLFTLDLAARLTTARPWPDGTPIDRPRSVVLVGREDNLQDTVLPRLLAAGADPARVVSFRVQDLDTGRNHPPIFPDDCELLRDTLLETDAALVIIDPLLAFLSHRVCYTSEQLVRRGLEPLTEVAEATGAAFQLVRHLNKGGRGLRALYRGLGGMAIVASVRLAFLAGLDPSDPSRRILAPLKTNAGACPPALAYRIAAGPDGRPFIDWLGPVNLAADDLVIPAARARGQAVPQAMAFLEELLTDGPVARDEILHQAHARGFSDRSLDRARAERGIHSGQCHRHGQNIRYWYLPSDAARYTPDNWDDPQHRRALTDAANRQVLDDLFSDSPPGAPVLRQSSIEG